MTNRLPTEISTNGFLPKPTIKQVYVNINDDKHIEVVVEVKDVVSRTNEGRQIGYWVSNREVENLINLNLSLEYSGMELHSESKNLTKDFLGTLPDILPQATSYPVVQTHSFYYKFFIPKAAVNYVGIPELPHPNFSVKVNTQYNEDAIRSKEGYSNFILPSGHGEFFQRELANRNVIKESEYDLNNFNTFDVILDEVDKFSPNLPDKKVEDCFSDLMTTYTRNGNALGIFSIDVNTIFDITNTYSNMLSKISPAKAEDILDSFAGNFMSNVEIIRTRVKGNSKLSVGKREPVFEEEHPSVNIVTFSSANLEQGTVEGTNGFIKKIPNLDTGTNRQVTHLTFTDTSFSQLNTGTYKYSVEITTNTDSYIKTIIQTDLANLNSNLSTVKDYYSQIDLHYDSVIERYTDSATVEYNNRGESLNTSIANIMSTISGYIKQDMTELVTTFQSITTHFDPVKSKPKYMLLFISIIEKAISKIEDLSGIPSPTSDDEDKSSGQVNGFSVDVRKYTFSQEVKASSVYSGMQYLDHDTDGLLEITRAEYGLRIEKEKSFYNAGGNSANTTNTFWADGVGESGYTFLAPLSYIDLKNNKHIIDNFSTPSAEDMESLLGTPKVLDSLSILRVSRELIAKSSTEGSMESFLDRVMMNEGVSMEQGTIPRRNEDGTRDRNQANEAIIEKRDKDYSRFSIATLKRKIQGHQKSPFGLRMKDNVLTNLMGNRLPESEVPEGFTFKKTPQHFRYQVVRDDRITLTSPSYFSRSESTFSQGLGSLFYFLTYGQIRKVQYLNSVSTNDSGVKSQVWKDLEKESLRQFSNPRLCRVVDYSNTTIGFKSDENSTVLNKYFVITSVGDLAGQDELLLSSDEFTYKFNDDGTVTITAVVPKIKADNLKGGKGGVSIGKENIEEPPPSSEDTGGEIETTLVTRKTIDELVETVINTKTTEPVPEMVVISGPLDPDLVSIVVEANPPTPDTVSRVERQKPAASRVERQKPAANLGNVTSQPVNLGGSGIRYMF